MARRTHPERPQGTEQELRERAFLDALQGSYQLSDAEFCRRERERLESWGLEPESDTAPEGAEGTP
jgi:hypothetical protein